MSHLIMKCAAAQIKFDLSTEWSRFAAVSDAVLTSPRGTGSMRQLLHVARTTGCGIVRALGALHSRHGCSNSKQVHLHCQAGRAI